VFGVGWQLSGVPSIRRRTDRGVPTYTEDDTFLGPSGEVLVKSLDQSRTLNTYTITTYRPRVEGSFDVIERWTSQTGDPDEVGLPGPRDFWIARGADGSQTFFGKMAALTGGNNDTVEWMAQESISADGQHIYYAWAGASGGDLYLNAVYYGNPAGDTELYSLPPGLPLLKNWLFALVFDLGTDAAPDIQQKPQGLSHYIRGSSTWTERKDPFSRFDAGFEIRTKYLCRQVLMYHYFPDGEINDADGNPQDKNGTLVRRMVFDYDENPAFSRLTSIQIAAYEPDANGTPQLLPPLDIHWSEDFNPPSGAPAWQELALPLTEPLGATTAPDFMPYGLTDLYSEGMSGLLHQQDNCWYYCRPVRDQRAGAAPDAITFDKRTLLPVVPTLQAGAGQLMDIDGDGCLEWLVTTLGNGSGYYRLGRDRQWSEFTPLTNVPLELMTPYAMYVNIHGAGLPDVVVLSPTSVRYYQNQSTDTEVKFAAPIDVAQDSAIVLPIPGRNPCEWVGFADVLGSGRPHLVRIRNDSLVCWPWLGNGKFGAPLTTTLPFDRSAFNPARISLVSVFGPNAPDLVYADVSELKIIRNQSGKSFDTTAANIVSIPYPAGVHMGALSQVSFTDLTGRGSPSVLLTQNFGGTSNAVRHWRLDLYPDSPAFQLRSVNNNMGAHCDLIWRNSIQDWMDEKSDDPTAPSGFPSPSMLIGAIHQVDEITGLQTVQSGRYRRGVWDGHERESRGYAYMETTHSTQVAASGVDADGTSAGISRSWYHTGRETDDHTSTFYPTPFSEPNAYQQQNARLTKPATVTAANPWHDAVYANPTDNTKWWMYRSLKGSLLRSETYDASQTLGSTPIPFSVQYNRWQVREVQPSATTPVVLPMELEQFAYQYEQVADDPLITQKIVMDTDDYGYELWSIDAAYPRRSGDASTNPYANSLPWYVSGNPTNGNPASVSTNNNSWTATHDAQQDYLRITESRFGVSNATATSDVWRLGVLDVSRENVLTYDSSAVPTGPYGLTVENLGDLGNSACLLAPGQTARHLKAYSTFTYANNLPPRLKLVSKTTTALLSKRDKDQIDQKDAALVAASGYKQLGALALATPDAPTEDPVWGGDFGITTYQAIEKFARPSTQTSSSLNGSDGHSPTTTYTWDAHECALVSTTDVYGNTLTGTIDYRFLTPNQLLDANQNMAQVQQDALGRVVATSFFGTQLSPDGTKVESVGFSDLSKNKASVPDTIADALANAATQQQATLTVYEMPGTAGAESQPAPARCLTLVADAYPSAGTAQVKRASITHVDGYGRVLRTATKVPSGQSFEVSTDGNLVSAKGSPPLATTSANSRWAVTGTSMQTPGGGVISVWPPYFANNWQFVNYSSLPLQGYADSFYFDALGREVLVRTGLNYWRRTSYAPWFTIEEDENDLEDAIGGATLKMLDTGMEPGSPLTAAAQDGQLPAMTTATGSAFVDNELVLEPASGTIFVSWKPGYTPDTGNIRTLSFTDTHGLSCSLAFDSVLQTIHMSLQSDADRWLPSDAGNINYAALLQGGRNDAIYEFAPGVVVDQTKNCVSGQLVLSPVSQTGWRWEWNLFDQFMVEIDYVSQSKTNPATTDDNPLFMCTPSYYASYIGPYMVPDDVSFDPSVWPYSTKTIDAKVRPAYRLVLARDGIDKSHWIATSDPNGSFNSTDSVRTEIPADYRMNSVTRLYTGIVCLDENDQIISESWRRAFFDAQLAT